MGRLEGLLVFQDNPLMRQMLGGVHTESGFTRMAMPILGKCHVARHSLPDGIIRLIQLQSNMLTDTTLLADRRNRDDLFGRTDCEEILKLLEGSNPHDLKPSFFYSNLMNMVTGQRVLVHMAKNILELIDRIPVCDFPVSKFPPVAYPRTFQFNFSLYSEKRRTRSW